LCSSFAILGAVSLTFSPKSRWLAAALGCFIYSWYGGFTKLSFSSKH